MKEKLLAIVQELQRLKREGVTSVSVSDETIAGLRTALANDASGGAVAAAHHEVGGPAREVATVHSSAAVAEPVATPSDFQALYTGRMSGVAETGLVKKASAANDTSKKLPTPPVVELPPGSKRERWEWLRQRVLECPVCRAHTHGDFQVVFGVGNIDADIFFCGEAPGGEEEIQGEPFVGPAGKLLTKMIVAMGLRREDVYIGNILNWRPEMEDRLGGRSIQQTGNRAPTEEEMRFGLPYLRAQVEAVSPKVIVALGSTAAEGLLGFGSFKSLGSVRGRWHEFNGTPLMVTYHPSYLLRNASNRTKRIVWEDLLQVMQRVGLPISEKQKQFFL